MMTGLDLLACVGVALIAWGGYRLWVAADEHDRREDERARLREEAWIRFSFLLDKPEDGQVPVDWWADLDEIRRLPETVV